MLVAGLDIGGTKTEAVAVDDGGQVVASVRRPSGQGEALVAIAVEVLRDLAAGSGVERFTRVGVGLPGLVSLDGTVRHAINLGIGSEAIAVGPKLEALVGAPVVVDNDARAAALGAAAVLAQRGDLAYLSVGTGVAMGLVVGGRLHRGSSGAAGEIGHLPVAPDGPSCECGQRGCLEAVASGAAIARAWATPDGQSAAVSLFDAADRGDPGAVALRDQVASHLAEAVARIVLTVDPDVVVLGGGLADVGERLGTAVVTALDERGARVPLLAALDIGQRVTVLPTGTPVGAIGAAAIGRGA